MGETDVTIGLATEIRASIDADKKTELKNKKRNREINLYFLTFTLFLTVSLR
jgi:hypothetical protein